MATDQISHLAHLGRLAIPATEQSRQERDFRDVVAFVDAIERVAAASTPLLSTISGRSHVLREDVSTPSLLADALVAVAPERKGRFIRVPAVLP